MAMATTVGNTGTVIPEIKEFLDNNPINEEFNYAAELKYRLVKDNKIIGIVAFMLVNDRDGKQIPQFIHVIIDKSIRRTRRAVAFVFSAFKDIQAKGYNKVYAVIPHEKKLMQRFATKFRFNNYGNDDKYSYWMLTFKKGG
jgi:hypothetical protein